MRESEVTARQLHERGESAAVVATQLLDEPSSGGWATGVLKRASDEAAGVGDFERAAEMLHRALEEVPAVIDLERVRMLIELGRVEAAAGLTDASRRWDTAADQLRELGAADRVRALVDLGEATYASGLLPAAYEHFEHAYELSGRIPEPEAVDDATQARIVAGLSTSSLLTGHRHRGVANRLESLIECTPEYPDLPTRALMASAAGEVSLGVDMPTATVRRLVDGAMGHEPLPGSVLRPMFEPLSAALSLTGRPNDAVTLLDAQLDEARSRNDIVAHVSLLPLRAHAHLLADRLENAREDALDAIDLIAKFPSATGLAEAPARYALSVALVELDELADAELACDVSDHRERWGNTPMHGWFLDGLARVRASEHRHHEAIRAWREASRAFTLVGGNGVICEWRDGLARSLIATNDAEAARDMSAEQLRLSDSFGDARMSAIAQATAAAVDPDHGLAAERLGAALQVLPRNTSELTRCRLGLERGTRLRRSGLRRAARDQLSVSLSIASRLGARRLVRLITDELINAGADATSMSDPARPDELTRAERQTAELAVHGLTNAEIARRRSVSRKTVESQLSSVYRKLGINDRTGLVDKVGPTSADAARAL